MYDCFIEKLKEKVDRNGLVNAANVNLILGPVLHIPKERRAKLLAEMIEKDMLEAVKTGHSYSYKVLD